MEAPASFCLKYWFGRWIIQSLIRKMAIYGNVFIFKNITKFREVQTKAVYIEKW